MRKGCDNFPAQRRLRQSESSHRLTYRSVHRGIYHKNFFIGGAAEILDSFMFMLRAQGSRGIRED